MSDLHAAPAVVIRLPLEAGPRITLKTRNAGELDRVCEWLSAHDDLRGLLLRALDVIEERAA